MSGIDLWGSRYHWRKTNTGLQYITRRPTDVARLPLPPTMQSFSPSYQYNANLLGNGINIIKPAYCGDNNGKPIMGTKLAAVSSPAKNW